MSRFDFIQTPLLGLMLVQRKAMKDHRGYAITDCGEGVAIIAFMLKASE
jgi:hypothetical protein